MSKGCLIKNIRTNNLECTGEHCLKCTTDTIQEIINSIEICKNTFKKEYKQVIELLSQTKNIIADIDTQIVKMNSSRG